VTDSENTAHPSPPPETLEGVLADAWEQLDIGVRSGRHGFHLPTLCTLDGYGIPQSRIVVFRSLDIEKRRLICHTDVRARKVTEVQRKLHATWCFYDKPLKMQVRAVTSAAVHTDDDLADRQWDASNNSSKRCYLAPAMPGTPTDHPSPNLPEDVRDHVPTDDRLFPARKHFAVIAAAISSLDVLYLHHAGHQRARFVWKSGRPLMSTWLEP
jgi:hypothetical protein